MTSQQHEQNRDLFPYLPTPLKSSFSKVDNIHGDLFQKHNSSQNPTRTMETDRFALPKASLIHSKTGKLQYGFPDRFSLKPHKPSMRRPSNRLCLSSSQTSLWTPRQPKAAPSPSPLPNQRHDPYAAYIQNIAEKERNQGYQQSLDRSAARCHHTSYGSRVRDEFGVKDALSWPVLGIGHRMATSLEPFQHGSDSWRVANMKSGVLIADTRDAKGTNLHAQDKTVIKSDGDLHTAATSLPWDVSRHAVCAASTPRFSARKEAETKKATYVDPAPQRNALRLLHHAERRASRIQKEKVLQDIMNAWPHGAPAAQIRAASRQGIAVGGLNYGSLQSMKEREYAALKPSLKI